MIRARCFFRLANLLPGEIFKSYPPKTLLPLVFLLSIGSMEAEAQQITEIYRTARIKPMLRKRRPVPLDTSTVQQLEATTVTPKLKPLVTSFDIMTRPEDFSSGNFLAPRINGTYSGSIVQKVLKINWGVNLNIQSPQTTKDTTAMTNRLLSSGGVGSISGNINLGCFSKDTTSGLTLSILPTFYWQNSQVVNNETADGFTYYATRINLQAWAGPLVLSLQGSYYSVSSASPKFIDRTMNNQLIWNIYGALYLDRGWYLQIKGVLGKPNFSKESLDVSFVKNLTWL